MSSQNLKIEKANFYEKIPVCSFTFGVPSTEVIAKLKREGIILIGTATTVREAVEIEKIGMDLVVVQGSGAGGQRPGSWFKVLIIPKVSLFHKLFQVKVI